MLDLELKIAKQLRILRTDRPLGTALPVRAEDGGRAATLYRDPEGIVWLVFAGEVWRREGPK